jgi:hypothetical protein
LSGVTDSQAGCARALAIFLPALALLAPASTVEAQAPPAPGPTAPAQGTAAPPVMKSLGGDRYQIGNVIIDKRARRLTVPGHVAHLGQAPLEYLAVTTHGLKAYETLLEMDATGSEFNLGLILIGFDAEKSTRPGAQFDRRYPGGDVARVEVSWTSGGRTRTVSADEALLTDAQRQQTPPSRWIYIASFTLKGQNGRYAADFAGTLVGFVHDPADVIEHRAGLGIGKYGSIQGNTALMPPVGTPVEMIVTATGAHIPPDVPDPPVSGSPPG